MILHFADILAGKTYVTKELLESLNGDIITDALESQQYDIKLQVNGVLIEPKLLEDLIKNQHEWINELAQQKIQKKSDNLENEINQFRNLFTDAFEAIKEKYQI